MVSSIFLLPSYIVSHFSSLPEGRATDFPDPPQGWRNVPFSLTWIPLRILSNPFASDPVRFYPCSLVGFKHTVNDKIIV
ncbi:unnamed protein product [Allacma fusca]|uniref:Uncharacterized protein n=1 Tax=Allacma fusca TaxID=39272 RepID=A0A8J2Q4C8_9HEXA|nr:unnamed protein product [Allacma fusca]